MEGKMLKPIEYATVSADGSMVDTWTLEAEESSADGKGDGALTLKRTLRHTFSTRYRDHTIHLELTPHNDFWRATKSASDVELLIATRAYLQQDWQNLLLVFENFADFCVLGFRCWERADTDYLTIDGESLEFYGLKKGQHASYNRRTDELLFQMEYEKSGPWLKLSPELHQLLFQKLKVSSVKQIVEGLKFSDYRHFGVLERLFGEFGREVNREPKESQDNFPTLERGGWLPVAGSSFYVSNFDEIRCREGLLIGENFNTLVELKSDPDNLQSESGFAVQILKDGQTLGFIKEGHARQLFSYLEAVGGVARCNANLYFSPVPEGIPQVNGEGGVPGNAIQLDLKIPQIEWIEDLLENSSNSSGPQLMSFD
jgi:hypothetical protein